MCESSHTLNQIRHDNCIMFHWMPSTTIFNCSRSWDLRGYKIWFSQISDYLYWKWWRHIILSYLFIFERSKALFIVSDEILLWWILISCQLLIEVDQLHNIPTPYIQIKGSNKESVAAAGLTLNLDGSYTTLVKKIYLFRVLELFCFLNCISWSQASRTLNHLYHECLYSHTLKLYLERAKIAKVWRIHRQLGSRN